MKTCYNCHGKISKVVKPITIEGITINDLVFEECEQCHEKYFDEQTAIFIQQIVEFVKQQRKKLLLAK